MRGFRRPDIRRRLGHYPSAVSDRPLRILFAAPAWSPSRAFGGPVVAANELVRRLVARGHDVDVLTTTILDLDRRPAARSSAGIVEGANVRYLATPLRYRWMGITPTRSEEHTTELQS